MTTAEAATDAQLMARVAAGDAAAFEVIYDRYRVPAYSLARRIAGTAAEDGMQDAFISLWRTAARFDPERGNLRSWVLTLVRNGCIDALRRHRTRAAGQAWPAEVLEQLPAPERTEEQVLAREGNREARQLLAGLPAEQRQVIELAYFGGFTQQEIARGMGVPLGTVKSRARIGLQKLRVAT
jgi:RNA polymerase sigma-70 factor (ECF subfamily)